MALEAVRAYARIHRPDRGYWVAGVVASRGLMSTAERLAFLPGRSGLVSRRR
jgi:hypothetical protein